MASALAGSSARRSQTPAASPARALRVVDSAHDLVVSYTQTNEDDVCNGIPFVN
jgi:hypothetical protein